MMSNEGVHIYLIRLSRPHLLLNQSSQCIAADMLWIDVTTRPAETVPGFEKVQREMTSTTATLAVVRAQLLRCGNGYKNT